MTVRARTAPTVTTILRIDDLHGAVALGFIMHCDSGLQGNDFHVQIALVVWNCPALEIFSLVSFIVPPIWGKCMKILVLKLDFRPSEESLFGLSAGG